MSEDRREDEKSDLGTISDFILNQPMPDKRVAQIKAQTAMRLNNFKDKHQTPCAKCQKLVKGDRYICLQCLREELKALTITQLLILFPRHTEQQVIELIEEVSK